MSFNSRHFRYVCFSVAGVLALCAAANSLSGQTAATKGPLKSIRNRPWPAAVQKVPDNAPTLSPADAMKTFYMAPGYHIELVAAEPLVHDPILMEFDGDGRMWVLEMEGWAVDQAMTNSRDPINKLVILEDTDHDGVYDKRTVFMDNLVLARAFKILDHNCALVGEPPNLWKACDTNGDLKSDTKELINNTFSTLGVIEHGANGLYWGMDNWIYVAEHTWNVFPKNGKFDIVPTLNRGQWGITQDDGGRIYRDVNTDPLYVDYVQAKYFMRNPNVIRTKGLYENLVKQEDSQVWPVRPTLGVNRGYREEVSRKDGSSYYYQGVSSPLIYRGTALPKELYGLPFVVDGPTNLVHLLNMKDDGTGRLSAADYYKKGEFLASTDERFRPVALAPGWDGTVYIVDMYRGVSQDGPIQTDFLRNYIQEHRLWENIGNGRIYRIVHDSSKFDKKPAMLEETPAQLVAHLSHPNGWWRDTAQQLLVQRNDKSVVPALKQLALKSPDFRARIQALWTLDGMDSIDEDTATLALSDKSADVRAAALRISEGWLSQAGSPIQSALMKKIDDPNWMVRRQLAASLGELPKDARVSSIVAVLEKYSDDQITVDAAVSSVPGQEADVLEKVISKPGLNNDALTMLAGAIARSRSLEGTQAVVSYATDAARPAAQKLALLSGAATGFEGGGNGRGGGGGGVAGGRAGGGVPGIGGGFGRGRGAAAPPQGLAFPSEPVALTALANGTGDLAAAARQIEARITWPGKPVVVVEVPKRTAEEEARYNTGKGIYDVTCAPCHQADGKGAEHLGAALVGSRFVTGPTSVLERIMVNGKEGSIGLMPPAGATMTDDNVAAVLTYIRGSWGNTASAVIPTDVKETRQMYAYRKTPWTEKELTAAGRGGGRGPAN